MDQNKELTAKITNLERKVSENSAKMEQLVAQSRRDNLKFHNYTGNTSEKMGTIRGES